jgi:hypothetical protein
MTPVFVYRLPLNSEPKNSTPKAAPRIPNVNIPMPHLF